MMTAAHCDNGRNAPRGDAYTYNPFTNRYGPTYVGPFDRSDEFNDAAAISAPSGAAIYTGGIDPYFQVNTVLNWGANPHGMIVRASGSFSGERSGIRVINNNSRWTFEQFGRTWLMGGVTAESSNSQATWGNGDSGGPVYTPDGTKVLARGIISANALNAGARCSGFEAPWRSCVWRGYYTRVGDALGALQLNINTG